MKKNHLNVQIDLFVNESELKEKQQVKAFKTVEI